MCLSLARLLSRPLACLLACLLGAYTRPPSQDFCFCLWRIRLHALRSCHPLLRGSSLPSYSASASLYKQRKPGDLFGLVQVRPGTARRHDAPKTPDLNMLRRLHNSSRRCFQSSRSWTDLAGHRRAATLTLCFGSLDFGGQLWSSFDQGAQNKTRRRILAEAPVRISRLLAAFCSMLRKAHLSKS